MAKHPQSIDSRILDRIRRHGAGWVFTPADFHDLGNRGAVAIALKRHKDAGLIRQVARGLYDVPRQHKALGVLWPDLDTVIDAIKRRDAVRLQPTGAYAANLLGLTEQVPMRVVFLTDGPQRTFKLGNLSISFKNTTPRNMATAGSISGLVIQAMRWMGQNNIDDATVKQLRKKLDRKAKAQLLADLRHAPVWIAERMREIAQDGKAR